MHLVGADWGTTHLRVFLIEVGSDGSCRLVDQRKGPGITGVAEGAFAATLEPLVVDWVAEYRIQSVVVSGMATSTLGWQEVPYAACPARVDDVLQQAVVVEIDGTPVHLVGGAQCRNPLGTFDVMRGEELQVFGGLRERPEPTLALLPGTHNKWVCAEDGRIEQFVTVPTGELFAVLSQHSILVSAEQVDSPEAFDAGVGAIRIHGAARLLPLLFSARASTLAGELPAHNAAAYLSGLLIGADVAAGLDLVRRSDWECEGTVIIAESWIASRYERALAAFDHGAEIVESATAALAGYSEYARNFARTSP